MAKPPRDVPEVDPDTRGQINPISSSKSECIVITFSCTDMQEKAKARLCELAPAARGSQEAGFTQPGLNLFPHICM